MTGSIGAQLRKKRGVKQYILKQKICEYRACRKTFHPHHEEDTTCSSLCAYEHWRIVGGLATNRVLDGRSLKHINSGPEEYSVPGLQRETSPEKIKKMIERHLRSR